MKATIFVLLTGFVGWAAKTPLKPPMDYVATVPHASHISMMATDFRYDQPPEEYDWTAKHYDRIMSGKIAEYRRRNPAIKFYVYAENLIVIQETHRDPPEIFTAYYNDMKHWYESHPAYKIEDAFLHNAAVCPAKKPKIRACRIQTTWAEHLRWVMNPGDAGLRAYNADRLHRIVTNLNQTGYDADGIFFDEHDSGVFSHWKTFSIREYPVWGRYEDDVIGLLTFERRALGKLIQLNTAEYISSMDQRMTLAAGSTHMELANNPLNDWLEDRWRFIDTLLQKGAYVEFVNAYTWKDAAVIPGLSRGNQPSPLLRFKMSELCSYYMVVPAVAANLSLFMGNDGWSVPMPQQWMKAIEVDVGHPLGPRTLAYQGKTSGGKPVRIWRREFGKALVFMRSKVSWDYNDYGDGSGVALNLPSGEKWHPLLGDGTLGPPATSVILRNPEGMIFIKGSALPRNH